MHRKKVLGDFENEPKSEIQKLVSKKNSSSDRMRIFSLSVGPLKIWAWDPNCETSLIGKIDDRNIVSYDQRFVRSLKQGCSLCVPWISVRHRNGCPNQVNCVFFTWALVAVDGQQGTHVP